MTKLKHFALALLTLVSIGAAQATPVVKVTDGEGVSAEFLLADSPQVSYVDGSLTVQAGDVMIAYPADKTYTFTLGESAAISDVLATKIEISAGGSTLRVTGLQPNEAVRLFDITGRMLTSACADGAGTVDFVLDSYIGVIIVSLTNQSFKIIK